MSKTSISEPKLLLDPEIQKKCLEQGSNYVKLLRPATVGGGIFRLTESEQGSLVKLYESEVQQWKVVKFVPASGAATRMFKHIFDWIADPEKHKDAIDAFFENVEDLPFFETWMEVADEHDLETFQTGLNAKVLWLNLLLNVQGLGLAYKPKGLIPFHVYDEGAFTPIYEHLKEAIAYSKHSEDVFLSFSVSPEHKDAFENEVNHLIKREEFQSFQWNLSFSHQSPETNTFALGADGEFVQEAGEWLQRPGGHGALIHNLNALPHDLVFIKNIDNVAHDRLLAETIQYKKVLGGMLFQFRNDLLALREHLNKGLVDEITINELRERWGLRIPREYQKLKAYLDRPIRVCGMVKNEGEPGGGPFWTMDPYTGESLQIVEQAQMDPKDARQRRIAEGATHFNPVDIVCATKNLKGEKIDLLEYIDSEQYFLVEKSHQGKPIKCLELPGLWNGAMAHWITLFVEVPISTFNPVKKVDDLFREAHR